MKLAVPYLPQKLDELRASLVSFIDQLVAGVNGQLSVDQNLEAQLIDVSLTLAADIEFPITHNLDRVPNGFTVVKNNKSSVVYNGGTAWTQSTIYLKSSQTNPNLTLLVL